MIAKLQHDFSRYNTGNLVNNEGKTRWTNFIEDLGCNRLRLHPSKMMDVMEDREVSGLISSCCPRNPNGKAGNEERRRRRRISFRKSKNHELYHMSVMMKAYLQKQLNTKPVSRNTMGFYSLSTSLGYPSVVYQLPNVYCATLKH